MASFVRVNAEYLTLAPFSWIADEIDAWKQVKKAYEDSHMLIFGDERYTCFRFGLHSSSCNLIALLIYSVGDKHDVAALAPLVHGINIKLEKAGGIRAGLQTMVVARSHQPPLKVWIGTWQ